jgi:hypothetical protein
MPGNSDPIFSRSGAISMRTAAALGVASNRTSTYDGTNATTDKILFTADATNGGYVQRIRFKALGTNVVSVARIYLNNGAAQTTATNNLFYGEISLPATTASNNTATVDIDYPLNVALPAGFTIIVGVSAAADLASGWTAGVIGGKY